MSFLIERGWLQGLHGPLCTALFLRAHSASRQSAIADRIAGMAVALAIFGIAFVVFCVWLTVRIVNRRERWAKRTLAAVVGLPVLYVASFGPVCWAYSRVPKGEEWEAPDYIYAPILRVWRFDHRIIPDAIEWYANVGSAIEVQAATKMNASDTDPTFLVRVILDDD